MACLAICSKRCPSCYRGNRSFSPEPTATAQYTVAVGSGLNEWPSATLIFYSTCQSLIGSRSALTQVFVDALRLAQQEGHLLCGQAQEARDDLHGLGKFLSKLVMLLI